MACITKRRDRWVIDCYDQHGKRYRKTLPEGTTKQRAREILRGIEEKIARRMFAHEKKMPLFSEVMKSWAEHKKPNLRANTWETVDGCMRIHLAEFNNVKIGLITTVTVEKFLAELQKKGFKLGTISWITTILNQIMAYAVRHRLIDSNPVRDAEKPRKQSTGIEGEDANKIKILTPDQIRIFLEAVDNQKYYTLFLMAVMTGARQGELLGLKWSDVDFQKKQIHIKRTFNHACFFLPKTKGAIRSIDLAPLLVSTLASWKLKSGGHEDNLVFPNDDGKPLYALSMVRKYFKPALKASGCPTIRFHDLRHTYASLLIDQGENIKYIQTQLGHSTPMMTLNVYSHLMKSENQEAAIRLEKSVFEFTGQKVVTNQGV